MGGDTGLWTDVVKTGALLKEILRGFAHYIVGFAHCCMCALLHGVDLSGGAEAALVERSALKSRRGLGNEVVDCLNFVVVESRRRHE